MSRLARRVRAALAIGTLVVLAGCATQFRNYGYAPSDADLANIVVGSDTRETVASLVGRPSTSGVLDEGGWYYVESRFRQLAFSAPREIEREVVAISFDGRGRVSNIERFGLEDGRVVTLSRRVTVSTVARVPFLRRILGGIGQAAGGLFN